MGSQSRDGYKPQTIFLVICIIFQNHYQSQETENFRTHFAMKLSKKEDMFGDSDEEVVGICTQHAIYEHIVTYQASWKIPGEGDEAEGRSYVTKGWILTLVLLYVTPLLLMFAVLVTVLAAKLISRGQSAKSAAAIVAEKTISSIRTVASFIGEKQGVAKYDKYLYIAYEDGVHEGLAARLDSSVSGSLLFSSYVLEVWFSAKIILHEGYSDGDVLNIMIVFAAGSSVI